MFSAGALRAWAPFLRDALAPALGIFEQEECKRILYRTIDDDGFAKIDQPDRPCPPPSYLALTAAFMLAELLGGTP